MKENLSWWTSSANQSLTSSVAVWISIQVKIVYSTCSSLEGWKIRSRFLKIRNSNPNRFSKPSIRSRLFMPEKISKVHLQASQRTLLSSTLIRLTKESACSKDITLQFFRKLWKSKRILNSSCWQISDSSTSHFSSLFSKKGRSAKARVSNTSKSSFLHNCFRPGQ